MAWVQVNSSLLCDCAQSLKKNNNNIIKVEGKWMDIVEIILE